MTELVHYHVRNGVATITLDSQHNRNALSARLMGELAGLLSRAATDEAVRVVVLTHAGRVFCSGMDLKASQGDDAAAMPVTAFPDILRTIWEFDKPMVARVAGPARAGRTKNGIYSSTWSSSGSRPSWPASCWSPRRPSRARPGPAGWA